MFIFCPFQVNTLFQRNPWGNLALLIVTIMVTLVELNGGLSDSTLDAMVLDGWSPGLLGHLFLHAGYLHLLGNMIFLFVFGNAICGIMNSWAYVAVYLGLGIFAGAVHVLVDGHLAVGASGAISGIVGLYLAVYPTNSIRCFWLFMIRFGVTEFAGWLLILFWFAMDIFGAVRGAGNTAYIAHLAGTVGGFALGLFMLSRGWVDIYDYDHPTVPQLFSRRKE